MFDKTVGLGNILVITTKKAPARFRPRRGLFHFPRSMFLRLSFKYTIGAFVLLSKIEHFSFKLGEIITANLLFSSKNFTSPA